MGAVPHGSMSCGAVQAARKELASGNPIYKLETAASDKMAIPRPFGLKNERLQQRIRI